MIKLKDILKEGKDTPKKPVQGIDCYKWITGFVNGTYQVKSTDLTPAEQGVYTLKFSISDKSQLKDFCDGKSDLSINCSIVEKTKSDPKSVDPLSVVNNIQLVFRHYDVKSYDDADAQEIGKDKLLWKFVIASAKYNGDTFTIDGNLSDNIFDTTANNTSNLTKTICELILDYLIWYAIKQKKILKYTKGNDAENNVYYDKHARNYRVITNTYGTQEEYPVIATVGKQVTDQGKGTSYGVPEKTLDQRSREMGGGSYYHPGKI